MNRASAPSALYYLIIQSMRNHQTRLGCWGLALLYIWPGTIQCTRETTLEGEEDREEKKDDYVAYQKKDKVVGQGKKEIKDCGRKGARQIMINVQKKNVRRAQSVDIWPRRTKTDITEFYLF